MRKIILVLGLFWRKELFELVSVLFEIVVSEVEEIIGVYLLFFDIVMLFVL